MFYHFEEDLKDKEYYILGFERGNHSWIIKRENRNSEFISSKCKLYMHLDTLKMDIKNCEDSRFNANYNVYIDTIEKNEKYYMIQLTLDSEDTYLQSFRQKLRYY